MVRGQRQEHVAERHVAAERHAHADQPPDHRLARHAQVPDHPDQPERQRPEQEPFGFGAVPVRHGYHEGGQDHPASERRERGDYGPHVSIVGVICGEGAMRPTAIASGGTPQPVAGIAEQSLNHPGRSVRIT